MGSIIPGDCRENGIGENQWMPFHAKERTNNSQVLFNLFIISIYIIKWLYLTRGFVAQW